MPLTNTLLIRAAYGWDEAKRQSSISAHGRQEALYGLGANSSPPDVQQIAQARLDVIAEPRYQYDAEHAPTSDVDLAYHGYGTLDRLVLTPPGDSPSAEVVSQIQVSEDENGNAVVKTSLNDSILWASPIENFVAMAHQAMKKMVPGTGRGDWKEAQPVTPPLIDTPISAQPAPAVFTLTGGFAAGATQFAYSFPDATSPVWGACRLDHIGGGSRISLLSSGVAPVTLDHSGPFVVVGVHQERVCATFSTAPVTIPAGAKVIFAFVRYSAEGLPITVFNTPHIYHPAFEFGEMTEIEPTSYNESPFLTFYSAEANDTLLESFTIVLYDYRTGFFTQLEEATEIAWIAYIIEPAWGSSGSDDERTGSGDDSLAVSGDQAIAFVMTSAPAIVPVINPGWTTISLLG